MNKDLKIIIIGFGSIGRRHYNNLLNLGFNNIFVYDPDKEKLAEKSLKTVPALTFEALKEFKLAFVCNPNNFHLETALNCARAGCHLFIEKPLSHDLEGIEELMKLVRVKKLITMVGCNMRFHPCLKFIKKYLIEGGLGRIYSINHEFGYFLPYWRPGQKYQENYAAQKRSGGGIILDDIHEFDLMFWLNNFEPVIKSEMIFDKISDLEIETEDISFVLFKFKNKVFGSVRCDYLQKSYSRNCKIVGSKGNLKWDFNESKVWLSSEEGDLILFQENDYNFNSVYLEEIKYFLTCLKQGEETFNNIPIAYQILKYCLKLKNGA